MCKKEMLILVIIVVIGITCACSYNSAGDGETKIKLEQRKVLEETEVDLVVNDYEEEVETEYDEDTEYSQPQEELTIQQEETSIVETEPVIEEPYNGIIQSEGNISTEFLKSVDSYYQLIPTNVRSLLESNNWQFICSSEEFTGRYGNSHKVLAMTVYEDRAIYIDNRNEAKDAIIHEVGHAFDACMGFISDNSSEFTSIYEEEKNSFCSVWSTNSKNTEGADEYFAEAFSVFVLNPELLSSNCPKTYEYIERYINMVVI